MPAFSSIATLRPDLFLSVLGSIFPDSLGAITCDSLDLWDIQVAGQPVSQILSLLLFGYLLLPYEVPKATITLLPAWFCLASESYYFFLISIILLLRISTCVLIHFCQLDTHSSHLGRGILNWETGSIILACGHVWAFFLMNDWCGQVQPIVDGANPGQVALGC